MVQKCIQPFHGEMSGVAGGRLNSCSLNVGNLLRCIKYCCVELGGFSQDQLIMCQLFKSLQLNDFLINVRVNKL